MDHHDNPRTPPGRRERLRRLLKGCRLRIDPEVRTLGSRERHPTRRGRRVTQEELSEAAGISRQWYAELELGRDVHASPVILGRLAAALMMDATEREALFALAIPEVAGTALGAAAEAVLQMSSLRPLMRRLWAATTEAEALTLILEDSTTRFPGIDLAMSDRRVAPGRWEFPVMFGSAGVRSRMADLAASINADLSDAELDECHLYGILTQPGQSGIFNNLYHELTVAPRLEHELRRCGFEKSAFLVAHVRSKREYEAMITVYRAAESPQFSDLDVAMFGALAEVASLALGGAALHP